MRCIRTWFSVSRPFALASACSAGHHCDATVVGLQNCRPTRALSTLGKMRGREGGGGVRGHCQVREEARRGPCETLPWAALALSLASYTPWCDGRNQLQKEDVPL